MSYDMLMAYPIPTNDSPTRLTPLSILFPGVWFEKQGLKVAYFDERFDSEERLEELIRASREIGVSAFTGYQTGRAARILKLAKRLNPAIVTGIGGHHARLFPKELLAEPFVDRVWEKRSYGEDLFPYNANTRIHFQRTHLQYMTSRGCPLPCTFCALVSPWVPKDIGVLERELKTIHADIGFKELSFSDPNIGFELYRDAAGKKARVSRLERIRAIGRIMRDLDAGWSGNIRSPYLSEEVVAALVAANCRSLEIGCESGNDFFLKKVIRKGHGVDAIRQAVRNIRGSGISMMYSFMARMPGETPEMLSDTFDLIDWIVANDPDARISIYQYAPYPGAPMYDEAVKGANGYPKFIPPTTMEGWGSLKLMRSPIYWIAGLCFREDNTRKNFPGDEVRLIQPYVDLAREKWRNRDIEDFPCEEVERVIAEQHRKRRLAAASASGT